MNKLFIILSLFLSALTMAGCNNSAKTKTTESKAIANVEQAPQTFDTEKLMQSALDGNLAIIETALENGFDVNTIDTNQRTALMLAAYNGHTSIVKLLIEKGADVNHTDQVNRTALMYASTGPFLPAVNALLEAGALPNKVDNEENWTALMMAAAEGQLKVVEALIAHGADISMVDIDGESSLDFANSKGHTEVVEYLKAQQK